ncbi:TPA: PTS-dependent dihydroxyacetone kinase operon transcriptional regulator DhaR, partial [Escherichia coli]|nr:PTS-dependent dihydroxyacetone kinase operon transcriptional regulator DhaR [Escherichia coli]HCQ2697719.1 PTS-dependent dihydroxyacetone kinase operon transcriptional regulator DhaR [Escherichia coli]HDH9072239.1 PTS-dependent dihydroxyacetone kinase operon transcriptional regulator DhaR [Escherichia coli]
MNKESYHNDLKNKWKMFVKHGWVATNSTNHVMLRSWQKCLKHCDPRHWNTPVKASGQTLQTIFSRNEEFIRISQRVVEDHFTLAGDDRLAFLIIDPHGWVLSLNAAGDYSSQLRELGIESGMSWAEDGIGTNVYSLCRETNLYTQLEGAEHFSEQLHCYAMSAAPVIDYYGNIHGYIVCIIETTAELVKLKTSYSCA